MQQQTSKTIVTVKSKKANALVGFPRDLETNDVVTSPNNNSLDEGPPDSQTSGGYNANWRPDTPIIVAIKSQEVKPGDAGKFTVDVVIEVSDDPLAKSYDIRIAKNAGYL